MQEGAFLYWRKKIKTSKKNLPRKKVSAYFSPKKNSIEHVVGFIDRTTEILDVAIYSATHPDIKNALLNAHKRGVKIRFLTDKAQAGNRYAIIRDLTAAGISARKDKKSGLMHDKFAVSDDYAVLTGSYNWTRGAEDKNAENFVIIRLKNVIQAFQEEFDMLWELNA